MSCYLQLGGNWIGTPSYIGNTAGGGVPVTTFYLLQEDGVSRIILEDGSGFLVLEH